MGGIQALRSPRTGNPSKCLVQGAEKGGKDVTECRRSVDAKELEQKSEEH